MIADRVDLILQFALARAAQEDFGSRELGPIHLLKLVYLADLEFATSHDGKTFTETPWRFHNYGPWDYNAFSRIAPVMAGIGATARTTTSVRYESESTFWSLDSREQATRSLYDRLDRALPASMTMTLARAIHQFGRDTSALLDFVYRTPPMIVAAPGETLDFSVVISRSAPPKPVPIEQPIVESLSRREQRLREQFNQVLLSKLRRKPAHGPRPGCVVPPAAPKDEVFIEGVRWLDSLAGSPVPEIHDGVLEFDPSVWRSDMRTPSDLS